MSILSSGGQRKTLDDLLYRFLPFSLEMGELDIILAQRVSELLVSACLYLPMLESQVCTAMTGFYHC